MARIERRPYLSNLPLRSQGKTRDMFNLPGNEDLMLVVATDAVSTHNVPHKSLIRDKGYVQNALNVYWAGGPLNGIKTHIVAYGGKIYDYLPKIQNYPEDLRYRAVVVRIYGIIPYEFIWRAYMAGSLYEKFYALGKPDPYGLILPEGLKLMSQFEKPVFTPTDKSEDDDPVNGVEVIKRYPGAVRLSKKIYDLGRCRAREAGNDIIDFKAEIAYDENNEPVLVDEWLNGDCTRIVRLADIKVGLIPPWRDKETVRQAAVKIWGTGPRVPLAFPSQVLARATADYREVFQEFSGMELEDFQKKVLA